MTDARLPETLLNNVRVRKLPDGPWRSYTYSLMWAVSNRTDGFIRPDDIEHIPMFRDGHQSNLVEAGLWVKWGKGWYIDRFDLDQTTRAQLDAADVARAKAREKKAEQRRRREATREESPSDLDVPGDVPGDNTGQDSDRTGQASYKGTTPETDDCSWCSNRGFSSPCPQCGRSEKSA